MYKIKTAIIITVIICIIISVFTFIIFRNGTVVKANHRENIAYSITPFRQNDKRWESDTLGTSAFTMKNSGCLTTCIASVLSYNSKETTPGELNNLFTENGVYDEQGNLVWSQLEKIYCTADVLSTVTEDAIYNYLKEGYFPIARVRVNGFGNFHYVLIVGVENGEYICMDPLKDNFTKLSDYMNRIYAIRVVYTPCSNDLIVIQ